MQYAQCLWIGRLAFIYAACLATVAGCGQPGNMVVFGTVTCAGQPVETGIVRLVPIEGTKGPLNVGLIAGGQYRIEARGGVPVGTYRVEVVAEKKTGRKVLGHIGAEEGMVDEIIQLGPVEYAGVKSPLRLEVGAGSDGPLDIDIPAQ